MDEAEFTVVFTEQAEQDLAQIVTYLAENWSEKVKTDFLVTLSDKLKILSQMPFLYRASQTEPGLRECVVNNQTLLYYRIVDNRVELLSLQSSRRDR